MGVTCVPTTIDSHDKATIEPIVKPKAKGVVLGMSNDAFEMAILGTAWILVAVMGSLLDVEGSAMSFRSIVLLMTLSSSMRHAYNSYLEWCYMKYPAMRTQPAKERPGKDTTGRAQDELDLMELHDRLTLVATSALTVATYYAVPSLYPPADDLAVPKAGGAAAASFWAARLVAHHYVLSFGMYWFHRYLHVNPFLWKHIHSLHHLAKTPLARTTYMDHWIDNLGNAIISETATQILVPLPPVLLFASRLIRIAESLEKHSGVSGPTNLAHTLQRWLPFAQMPHHHDWHHEGHKNSNYTFASLGGVWDVAFGTRHHGRAARCFSTAATKADIAALENRVHKARGRSILDHPAVCPLPLVALALAVYAKAKAL